MEQTMPQDTLLTLRIEEHEIPILFSQLCVDGQILSHPAVVQRQELPEVEHDSYLNLFVQGTTSHAPSNDPNAPISSSHTLAPLMERAARCEETMIKGPTKVTYF